MVEIPPRQARQVFPNAFLQSKTQGRAVEGMKKRALDKETLIIIVVVGIVSLWTVSRILSVAGPDQVTPSKPVVVNRENVPLATGKEPIEKIFIQSGCAACHTIPGISAAKGREGPKLILGTNARKRLHDPNYKGAAETEWEYVQESILNPGAFVVQGYPDRVMPRWYGQKLSSGALDKMTQYLLEIREDGKTSP